MAERKAVNKYYPPDWDPSKGSVNKRVGQHPLRERARKLSQGILIIRFEMPYNIWCGGCNIHIGMGVRYNAEKKKVGNYYTTPIYRFRMKCHLCDNYIEIETDPKNCDYTIVAGARRKEERWDPVAAENVIATDHADKQKMIDDAMFKLEHGEKDKKKSKAAIPGLVQIKDMQTQWKDDFGLNQMLRKKFRQEKKVILRKEEKDQEIKEKGGLNLHLVNESPEDIALAKKIKYRNEGYELEKRKKRLQIKNRPMFSKSSESNVHRSRLLEKRQKIMFSRKSSLENFSKNRKDELIKKTQSYDAVIVSKEKDDSTSKVINEKIEETSLLTSETVNGTDNIPVAKKTENSSNNMDDDLPKTFPNTYQNLSETSAKRFIDGENKEFITENLKSREPQLSLVSEMYSDTDSDSSK
ncbi:probable splicing factor YJU2B [Xenia sp. Carnegie-2017]|uniref:probable splicing factor YJU2B n=1 Tax=Xenia sp. Carnegie-2017 TaxID=2897299 RepID=UPI001F03EBC3|nr:probable splicing factor YJU2B [Xenia sp. Carnegie-2017]